MRSPRRLQKFEKSASKACSHMCSACPTASTCGDIEDMVGPPLNRGPAATVAAHCDNSDSIFDLNMYKETQKPLLEASTLPGHVYYSPRWYERELETVFAPGWTLVCREDEVAKEGDCFAIDTEWTGPVSICRGEEGKLFAMANTCCHRGAKVMKDGKGRASKHGHVCPYHAWTYDNDGQLKWAPGMHTVESFDEEIRLPPVRHDVWRGFIFVTLNNDAPSVCDSLGDLPNVLPAWFAHDDGALNNMVTVARREFMVDCNWKFLMENTCETYHTAVVHSDSLGPMKSAPVGPHSGDWDAVKVFTDRSVVPLPADFGGQQMLPTFTQDTAFVNLFPSLQVNATWDCAWFMHVKPVSVSRTEISMGFMFPKKSTIQPDFDVILAQYLKRWELAVSEDNGISLNQQRSVRSPLRKPGRFNQLEFGTHNFNNWLLSKVIDDYQWNPGQRISLGQKSWSNDDMHLRALVEAVTIQSKL